MNTYVAFYKGRQKVVTAATSFEAQKVAATLFGAKVSWKVNVVLAEKDGKPVIHTPSF